MTVQLPASGDGSRRRRRRERQRGGRRILLRILAAVALLAVLAALVWVVVDLVGGDGDGPGPAATDDGGGTPGAPPGMLVLRDGAGAIYGVTVFAPATATIVHVPPGTLVEVPSVGLASLAEAFEEGGETLLTQSLENVVGVRFAEVVVLDPAAVAELLAPVAPLAVSVSEAVRQRADSGRVEVVIPAGAQELSGEGALTFLSALGDGTALDRLVRHQAFWSAYLAESAAAPTLAAARQLVGDEVQQRVLPVEAVAGVSGGEELYRIAEDDLAPFVARHLPGAVDPEARIRVQVLNGVGAPGIAQRIQPLLVDAGARLMLSGNADRFDYEVSQIVYYDDDGVEDARSIRDALGVGEVVKSLTGLDVVDVTVVVGADFLASDTGG